MKRLIRSRKSGLYLLEGGAWAGDWQQAKGFEAFQDAWAEKEKYHLREVDLVLVVGDTPSTHYDVITPLADAPP